MNAVDLLPVRFQQKIAVSVGEHWMWLGWTNSAGYPYVRFGGRDVPAYRATYQLLVGAIPAGMEIDHLCQTPRCVNPEHLEVVSHAENLRRIQDRMMACRRAGHDWSDPRNVYVRRNGRRWCAACARQDAKGRRQ